ncbi:MAG: hypothetical protein H6R34_835, partial [Bacteroidetes bacterium]|nr:hypothetical protein [Bacteroidota bacterium]
MKTVRIITIRDKPSVSDQFFKIIFQKTIRIFIAYAMIIKIIKVCI